MVDTGDQGSDVQGEERGEDGTKPVLASEVYEEGIPLGDSRTPGLDRDGAARSRTGIPTPDDDPFYECPAGLDEIEPGTVLRSRPVQVAFFGRVRHGGATQLLYRSTDAHGRAEAAVTTVIVPAENDPARLPVLSYQCAIDAVASRCFPSYALRLGADLVGASVQAEFLFIAAALARGWAVSVPDHEGVKGMWGAPYEAGFRVLDGLRAAVNHGPMGLSVSAPMAMWGYSGGGLATGWAAEAAADYAPELDLIGAVMGSPVVDPESVARRLNRSTWAGLAALMVASLVHIFPEARQVVDEHATESGKALLVEIEGMSTGAAIRRLRGTDIADYVDLSFEELFALPALRHVFEMTRLGQATPAMPVLMIQGVHDKIVDVADVDALVATYAAGGATVSYHRDPLAEHLLLYPFAVPMSLRWLSARLDTRTGRAARRTWPALLDPGTYVGMTSLGVAGTAAAVRRIVSRSPSSP